MYYQTQNRIPLSQEQYHLTISPRRFEAQGLRIALNQTFTNYMIRVGISLMQINSLQYGQLSGVANRISAKDYRYEAEVDYYYDKDKLFKRESVDFTEGFGWSIDLSGAGKTQQGWEYNWFARDLLGELRWDKAPRTRAHIASQTVSYDAQGYAIISPLSLAIIR